MIVAAPVWPRSIRWVALATVVAFVAACLPAAARHYNTIGDKASAKRDYERAIAAYESSLKIESDQPKVIQRLEDARVLLKQVYVDKIYELIDRSRAPVEEFLDAWRMSSKLATVRVPAPRIITIRRDLRKRFATSEKILRGATEPHRYFSHLERMNELVPDGAVLGALNEVGAALTTSHLEQRSAADKKGRQGLALLHTVAAATFAPRDTGLWADAARRRSGLRERLSLALDLDVKAAGGQRARFEGGIRRRLPAIFILTRGAPLALTLDVQRAEPLERKLVNRHNAKCQVGVRRVANPECGALERKAKAAEETLQARQRALGAAADRCASAQQATDCNTYVSTADRDVRSAKDELDRIEDKRGKCPETIEEPVNRIFFYTRHLLQRQVSVAARLSFRRGGAVVSARGVSGSVSARDSYGQGLACARISADPLNIKSMSVLQLAAEEQLLNRSMAELIAIRRKHAQAQLAGQDASEQRWDALVRARLVDDTFKLARQQLVRNITRVWSDDFRIADRILR